MIEVASGVVVIVSRREIASSSGFCKTAYGPFNGPAEGYGFMVEEMKKPDCLNVEMIPVVKK